MSRGVRAAIAGLALSAAAAAPARGQGLGGRMTVEAVGSASTTATAPGDPTLIFDSTATVRVGNGLDVVVRPYAHRLAGGDWTAEMYQLQVRYLAPTPLRLRVDAGIITGPVGQTSLELIPDRNPTIGGPFFYYAPLPPITDTPERLLVIAPGYPLGVVASVSGDRWDARAGVTDQTPVRRRNVLASSRPKAAPQLVAGGGFTPAPGLRVGAGFAQGDYDPARGRGATILNVEADYAIGYTRVAGEWIRDSFETAGEPAIVHAITAEAVRTLSPRWFAAVRGSHVTAPVRLGPVARQKQADSAEITLGYRVAPELTLKGGYQSSHWYYSSKWNGAVAVSAVVSRRWW